MKAFGLTSTQISKAGAVELGVLLLLCASVFATDTIVYSNGPDPGEIVLLGNDPRGCCDEFLHTQRADYDSCHKVFGV